MTRIDEEFSRLNAANTKLMNAISETYDSDFDFEKNGEEKCNQLRELILGLEKSEFIAKFYQMIEEAPKGCNIKCKTQYYAWVANEICMQASSYKWSNFGGDNVSEELRVGCFARIGGKFFYKGRELESINQKPDSVSSYILEKLMRSPGLFLADEILDAEIKGRRGSAKHRISELKKDLAKTPGCKEVIKRDRRPLGYGEATGYSLIID